MSGGSTPHWAQIGESTSVAGIAFLCGVHRWLGRWPFRVCLLPVVLCHWAFNRVGRRSSLAYLQQLQASTGALGHAPGWRDTFRHFFRFADTLLDKILGLGGQYPASSIDIDNRLMLAQIEQGRGGVLLTAHIGCLELCQSLAEQVPGFHVTILVHTAHAQRFNAILRRLAPSASVELVQVTEVGPATAMQLSQRVAAGGFVAIVGDRVPVSGSRVAWASFLGRRAPFPVGGYVLASALGCPVYTMSCLHEGDGYRVHFAHFSERLTLPRATREEALAEQAQRFASWLEQQVTQSPLDWFNFFPFWDQASDAK